MESIVVVIVSACHFLMVDPATKDIMCKDFELPPFTENMNALQCIMGAQAQVAKIWWPQHQQWKIKRITCEVRKGIGSPALKRDI